MTNIIQYYDPMTNQVFLANEEVLEEASKELERILDEKFKKEKQGFVFANDPDILEVFYEQLGMPQPNRTKKHGWLWNKCIEMES